ncbi:mycothione reductase [Luteipulveratus sp. YIM 133132]|uniref:mycothione reductase n=1 Tax=Luteipulveratus flavus TaxID=3031728 RepID=UPI0023B14E18|nr:mycothione reductase [Luteipulveratus sp. YIM 133132]MDE9367716.1 mycothione reductase [Luteipulveratus sp. YIM 133132]
MTTTHFDLAIIGTGSGNSLVTPDFDGKRVAVIEEGTFGGTCLNVGCIPTKMFVYASDVADHVREAARYGVDAALDGVRWRDIRDRIFGRIDPISEGGKDYRVNGPNTTAFLGHATFVGPRELIVEVDGRHETVTADQIVVAAGARPVIPQLIQESGVPFHTSDTVMRIDELPRSMVILGGGFISAEMAHVFSALGVDVRIVTRGPAMLRVEDAEISERFTQVAQRQWEVHLSATIEDVKGDESGVTLTLPDGTTVEGETLLVATGRRPNTDRLGLEAAGIATHTDGRIVVDEFGRTAVDGVWALGDISSLHQLKHVANHEARVVAHNLVHPDDLRAFDHRFVPAAVFSHPQVASVGLTEQQAREAGHDVTTKTQAYGDVAYGWAMEDTTGICKLVADRATGELLGAHLLGPMASSLIQPAIQAMSFGLRVHEMARGQYWIHPALAEVLENALLGLEVPGQE